MKYGDNVTQNAECTWMPRNEPEKLYYETQNDNGNGSRGNKEGTARKSEMSPRRKRRRRARTLGDHKGW